MPSEISFVDGRAEAAFTLKPAWWDVAGEYVLDHVPDGEGMIRAAHLDWTVEKQPVFDRKGTPIPGYATVVREDTGGHLGIVSDRYQPVQNKDAFRFLDSLLMDGIMRYESAGVLRGGRTVWALARMPGVDEVAEGDTLRRYVLWLNSHDGTGALYAIPTSVRVVCANTAALAVRGQKGIRHTGDMAGKLDEAHLLLSQANEQFTRFRQRAETLAARTASPAQVTEYLDTLLPEPENAPRSLGNWKRRREEIRLAYGNERQNLPAITGTWWALYNAVSEVIDHGDFFRFHGSERTRRENRMASVLTGRGADLKAQAFQLAFSMAV